MKKKQINTRTYKTPEAIGISKRFFNILKKVRHDLASGKIEHTADTDATPSKGDRLFNMESWGGNCGTVCCIGGWCEAYNKKKFAWQVKNWELHEEIQRMEGSNHPLFYPRTIADWSTITPGMAARAIDTFLSGKVDWRYAIKNPVKIRRPKAKRRIVVQQSFKITTIDQKFIADETKNS